MQKTRVILIFLLLLLLITGCNRNETPISDTEVITAELFETQEILSAKLSILKSFGDDAAEIRWDGKMEIEGTECYTYTVYMMMEQDDGKQIHHELHQVGMFGITTQDSRIFASTDGEGWKPWDIPEVYSINTAVVQFPAYQKGINEYNKSIYEITPFHVTLILPEGWKTRSPEDANRNPDNCFTPVDIYNGDEYIAFMGFNVFTPYDGEIAEGDYYKSVYSFLRLSSMYYMDSYTPVRKWETGETAVATFTYMDEKEIEKHPGAMPDVPRIEVPLILSYDKKMQVYIGLQFAEDVVTDEQVMAIADSINLQLT